MNDSSNPAGDLLSVTAARAVFNSTVEEQIRRFPDTQLLQRLNRGDMDISHYHAILCTLFHQTYSAPYTFARAAVNCGWRHELAKEYLLRHAEEERTHWRWVLDDLRSTGYRGPSPRDEPPHYTTQAYIGLNYYVAEQVPIARLAIASVLEGIGAAHGAAYGTKLAKTLNLDKSQATFFLSHAQTDIVHTAELGDVISVCDLSSEEWRWMNHTAETAGLFYRAMYDHEAFA